MRSAGLLPYRLGTGLEVLIAHPGGPFFARKDADAWTIVKGLVEPGETDQQTARREFAEETGWNAPDGGWVELGETTMRSRKKVVAWGVEASFDPESLQPGMFTMYGREFPEIDRVAWHEPQEARRLLNPALEVFVDRLAAHVGLNGGP